MSLITPNPAELFSANIAAETENSEANTVVTGREGKKIVVIGYVVNTNAEGKVEFKDKESTVRATFDFAKTGGAVFTGSIDCPAFLCATGKSLVIKNPAGVKTFGHITYCFTI